MALDWRTNAFRPDLADSRLQGHVDAQKFVDGELATIVEPRVALRARPDETAGFTTEALLGDRVRVFERKESWAWVQMEKDAYVGYLPVAAVTSGLTTPTHRVCVPATFVYPQPDLKSQPATRIFLNSLLVVEDVTDDWAALVGGGYVFNSHIAASDSFQDDPVAMAEQFVGVPYLWGGNTQDGLDCSALVQQAYHATGRDCPRDSDMIEQTIGDIGQNSMQRGDLVFWDGHIGMMIDERRMIHANGHHMAVAIEDFAEAQERIGRTYASSARFKRVNR